MDAIKINGKTGFIVLETTWSERHWVRTMLGPTDGNTKIATKEAPLLAKILAYYDEHGLWVELNTTKSQREPQKPRFQMMIPWPAIVTVVVLPDDEPDADADELRRLYELESE